MKSKYQIYYLVVIVLLLINKSNGQDIMPENTISSSMTKVVQNISNNYGVSKKEIYNLKINSDPQDATRVVNLSLLPINDLPNSLFKENNISHKSMVIRTLLQNYDTIYPQVSNEYLINIIKELSKMNKNNQKYIHIFLGKISENLKSNDSDSVSINEIIAHFKNVLPLKNMIETRIILNIIHDQFDSSKAEEILENVLQKELSPQEKPYYQEIKEQWRNPIEYEKKLPKIIH